MDLQQTLICTSSCGKRQRERNDHGSGASLVLRGVVWYCLVLFGLVGSGLVWLWCVMFWVVVVVVVVRTLCFTRVSVHSRARMHRIRVAERLGVKLAASPPPPSPR